MGAFFDTLSSGGALLAASQAAKQGRKSVKAVRAVPTGPVQKATTESIIATAVPENLASQFTAQAARLFQAQGRAISKATPGAGVVRSDATRSGGRVARLLAAESERGGIVAAGEERLATLRRDVGTQRLGRLAGASRLESSQKVARTKKTELRRELFQRGRAGVGQELGLGIGGAIKAFAGGA